jgi:hypothetical protein
VIAGLAAVAMIMMQLAVAAETCMPRSASGAPAQAAADRAPCHEMDGAAPHDRCIQRCDAVKHSPDHSPSSFAPLLTPIHPVRPPARDFASAHVRIDSSVLLTRATAPPLAVRNCCFRT